MATDSGARGDWLHQGTSDAREIAAQYDEWARSYDDDLASWSYQAPAVVSRTLLAHLPASGSVLDVGCGTGLVGRTLRAQGFVGRIVGVDISEESLDLARESGAYDMVADVDLQQRLPFADDGVDAVACVGVMTYLPDVERTWRDFTRATRPGGLVVATQREDLWHPRGCPALVDRLQDEGVWTSVEVEGPAPYLPEGYGGTPKVDCYYLTAYVG